MARKQKIKKLDWDVAYSNLANLLTAFYLEYKEKSPELLYRLVQDQNKFIVKENWFKNRKTYKSNGLDPIHVFASFNNNKQRIEDRYLIFCEWVEILNGQNIFEEINFEGCPSPFTIKILSGRKLEDQLDIWRTFLSVHKNGKSAISNDLLPKIKKWYGINLPSFTIFLYWIDCKTYLSLDKNTTNYLFKTQENFVVPTNLKEYLNLLARIPIGLNKTIVSVAYDNKLIDRLPPSKRSSLDKFTRRIAFVRNDEIVTNAKISFRLIAIKVPERFDSDYRKNLKNETYRFYQGYTVDQDKIILDKDKLFDLYSGININISLNAIVGKNGSGKSALSELLFIAINNLYYYSLGANGTEQFDWVEGVHMELFFETYGVFQLVFADKTITAYEYLKIGEIEYQRAEESTPIDKAFLEKFFYTLSVNYSLYGLNSNHLNSWLEKLFVKNDGYENPIVLEPNRIKGHINIQRQEELVRSRFLANLLEFLEYESLENKDTNSLKIESPENTYVQDSYRFIRENIEVRNIKLQINSQKTSTIFVKSDGTKIINKSQIVNYDDLIKSIEKNFKIMAVRLDQIDFDDNTSVESISLRYIIQKLYKIVNQYKPYISLFWDEDKEEFKSVKLFILKLKTDQTHVTNKLFQAINFLDRKIVYQSGGYELDAMSANIIVSKSEYVDFNENELRTIHLLPPSFFNVNIGVVDVTHPNPKVYPFEQLSSGERQQIYSINSIIYHLKNLDSVDFDERIQYRCVNLVLDEVELYAHPEMQREYIYYLINLIKRVEWSNLSGINICFITHSPFILSDIPSERILFLDQNGRQVKLIKAKTFGANIHELLVDGFFLSNTIGEFALKQIEDIVSFHSLVLNATKMEIPNLNEKYKLKRPFFIYVVENIGEDYIRGILKNHITDIDKILDKDFFQKQTLKELEAEVERLKQLINAKD